MKRVFLVLSLTLAATAAHSAVAADDAIVLTSPKWLGKIDVPPAELEAIQKAVVKALDAPIDAEQQCGEETGLCTVRTARAWTHEGSRMREIVINVHMIGHASQTVREVNGKWPDVRVK